jgi:nicotinate-nucleotide adenylyltransferase
LIKGTKKNIGVLGGTFDPVHKGHLTISRIAIQKLKIQKLFWSITKQNPLKKLKPLIDEKKRILLCKKIIKKEKKIFILNTKKIKNSQFTHNVISSMRRRINVNQKLFFIIGADNLINFHKWKNFKKIMSLSTLVVMNRPGYKKKALNSFIGKKFKKFKTNLSYINKNMPKNYQWVFINNRGINISSSKLRINLYK